MLTDFALAAVRIFPGHPVFLAPEKRSTKYGKGPWDSVSDVDAGPAHRLTACLHQDGAVFEEGCQLIGQRRSYLLSWALHSAHSRALESAEAKLQLHNEGK